MDLILTSKTFRPNVSFVYVDWKQHMSGCKVHLFSRRNWPHGDSFSCYNTIWVSSDGNLIISSIDSLSLDFCAAMLHTTMSRRMWKDVAMVLWLSKLAGEREVSGLNFANLFCGYLMVKKICQY